MTEKVLNWLRGFAPFAGMMTEFVGVSPGCCGLFPKGQTEKQTGRDILGNVRLSCCREYRICYRAVPGASAAAVLDGFARWVEGNGTIPKMGKNTRVSVKNAGLTAREQTGTAIYEMQLEFTWEDIPLRDKTTRYGVNSQGLLAPDDPVTVTVQTVEDPLSGYDEQGYLHRYPLNTVHCWQFTYTHLTQTEKAYLERLFAGDTFWLDHPGGRAKCYLDGWESDLTEDAGTWTERIRVKEA